MKISMLFESKAHFIEFCAIEELRKGFVREASRAWESCREVHLDVFVKAYVFARQSDWEDSHRWN